jgi:2-polyprenyl-3-methyl-5-hydroxy-6-metoxy-1,4-benzoquinol methylase
VPALSEYARRKKIDHFFRDVPREARILEVGSGDGWLKREMARRGWRDYVGIDLKPPADVVGSILDWRSLGLPPGSFDVVIAFEVVEHVHCFREIFDLLKPGGLLVLTSPVPRMDWLCRLLELAGLNQKRTSPHDHLISFRQIPLFEPIEIRTVGLMAQWGKFRKPLEPTD